ncbi:Npr3p PWA37_000571 [Arxiozyma heterogenica]|uniref:Npr3p n=1 Tax=Arxiozyma heterogenica TaxID=278026 RepID=UPI002F0CC3F6
MSEYLPNSYLLGVHLTISTHSGPLMVYSYPPAKIDAIEKLTSIYSMTTNNKNHLNKLAQINMVHNETGYSRTVNVSSKKDQNNKRYITNQITPTSDFRFDFDSSIRSKTSLRTMSSQSSLSPVSSSSSPETKSWLSSEGLSESELSTDYLDESFSSDGDSSESSSFSSSLITNHMQSLNIDNEIMEKKKILPEEEGERPGAASHGVITGDRLLKLFDSVSKISDDDDKSGFNQTYFDNDDDNVNYDDRDRNRFLNKNMINDFFFNEENFQDIDKIFGFNSEFVAEFCCPDRELCNTKFEFTIDQIAFLGLPIHNDINGEWRKSKHKKHNSSKKSVSRSSSTIRSHKESSQVSSSKNLIKKQNINKDITSKVDRSEAFNGINNLSDSDEQEEGNQDERDVTDDEGDGDDIEFHDLDKSMNMFHVCFVLNPPLIEYNERIDDIYQHVVVKLALLLRYLQSKSNYVSEECEIIMRERENVIKNSKKYQSLKSSSERGKFLYERILSKSTLAQALTQCVDQIHKNEIACINIGGRIISLQIPIQNEFQHLPDYKVNPILTHSFLSTMTNNIFLRRSGNPFEVQQTEFLNSNNTDDLFNIDEDVLNYSLLLLDEPQNIIKNLENTSQSAKMDDINNILLIQMVKNIQPTTPLNKYHSIISEFLQIEIGPLTSKVLRSCALHLIYWRHARVIIPLSSKNTYIVSPLVSLSASYPQDEVIFKEKFNALPSLSYFLNKLSSIENSDSSVNKKLGNGNNIDNSNNSNSNNNNNSLLMLNKRGVKPFGSLIPSKEHKGVYLSVLSWLLRHGYVCQLLTFVFIRVDKRIKIAVEEELEREGYKNKKGQILNKKRMATVKARNSVIQSSQHFENLDKNGDNALLDIKGIGGIELDGIEDHFEFDDPDLQQDYTIILEPERVTALEKRWLYRCISEQPPDIQVLFKRLLKYFNGRTPMETVMLREGVTRHELRKLFNALNRYVVEIHHW